MQDNVDQVLNAQLSKFNQDEVFTLIDECQQKLKAQEIKYSELQMEYQELKLENEKLK